MAQRQFKSTDTSTWEERFGAGSAGAYTMGGPVTYAPTDSAFTGTASATVGVATGSFTSGGGDVVIIHQTQGTGVGNWELNKTTSYSAGAMNFKYPLINTYGTGAQVVLIPQYTTVSISDVLTSKAWNGTTGGLQVFLASISFTGTAGGAIGANSKGYRGQAGSNPATDPARQGEGTTGVGGGTSTAANGSGGGGGTADAAGSGGGGHAAAGTNGTNGTHGATGGTAGVLSGNAALTSLTFGGGGAQGAGVNGQATTGTGGTGGGIVMIFAPNIDISALGSTINTDGGSGTAGSAPDSTYHSTGGGGGAGGATLLKGQTVNVGTNKITAAAGAGGGNNFGQTHCGSSGAGSVGRIHVDYATSFVGTASPTIDSTLDLSLLSGATSRAFLM